MSYKKGERGSPGLLLESPIRYNKEKNSTLKIMKYRMKINDAQFRKR